MNLFALYVENSVQRYHKFQKQMYCKQKYPEKLQNLFKNIGNWKNITAKLLALKFSAGKQ